MIRFNVNMAGAKGFALPAVPALWAGVWHEGQAWGVDMAALRLALPYRWRKAFDRASGPWFPKSACLPAKGFDTKANETPQGHIALHDRRGRYLTTVYLNAQEVKAA
jgi:hypothetical protein